MITEHCEYVAHMESSLVNLKQNRAYITNLSEWVSVWVCVFEIKINRISNRTTFQIHSEYIYRSPCYFNNVHSFKMINDQTSTHFVAIFRIEDVKDRRKEEEEEVSRERDQNPKFHQRFWRNTKGKIRDELSWCETG